MTSSDSQRDPLEQLADEFAQRYRCGERPTLTEYVRRYPQLAGEIRELFPALVEMEQLRHVADGPGFPGAGVGMQPEQLGDYRILREVARGGMGIVYEAEQESLGRHVALKVLPLHGLMNATQLERFRREARAAARLHHTNIVPVFGVGQDQGIHYYAMQFIQGQSLDLVLRELRRLRGKPELAGGEARGSWARSAAHRMLSGQFSGNGDHKASQNGRSAEVPLSALGGVLVTSAANHTEWGSQSEAQYYRSVAQLGVQVAEALAYAHEQGILHRDIKPSNLLLDTHGTAWVTDFGLAKDEESDELTRSGDIVGTLRYMAPERFEGHSDARSDVYGLGITLYETLTLEPAFDAKDRAELLRRISHEAPPSPRRVNRAVPLDLETIVLKATAKGADERYASAGELAEDLRRFLQDRPILARRPNFAQRAAKWARRHRPLVWAAAVLLCVTTVGSTVSALLIAQQRDAAQVALHRESEAARRERLAAAAAREQQSLAEREQERAERNFRLAQDAVDRMFTRVAQDLKDKPHMGQIRRDLLEDALAFYQGFLQQEATDPTTRYETARAYRRVADIYMMFGRLDEVEAPLKQAVALLEQLSADFPSVPEYRSELAGLYQTVGELFGAHLLNVPDRGVESNVAALAIGRKLAADFPDRPEFRRSVADQLWIVGLTYSRGLLNTHEGEKYLRESLAAWKQIRKESPNDPGVQLGLARAHHWLGSLFLDTNRLREAEAEIRQALALREQVLANRPADHLLIHHIAHTKAYLALILSATGRAAEAEPLIRDAISTREKVLDDYPDSLENWRRLNFEYGNLSECLLELGRTEEAEQAIRRRIAICQKLAADFPDRARNNVLDLSTAHYGLGLVLHATHRPLEAADAFRQAIGLLERLTAEVPDTVSYKRHLGWKLATCPAVQFRDAGRALALAKLVLKHQPGAWHHWRLLGLAQYRAGDPAGAIASLQKAMALSSGGEGLDWFLLAMAHWQLGKKDEAGRWYQQAVDWIDKNQPGNLEARGFRAEAQKLMGLAGDESPRDAFP